jgi:NAD+ kinase
MKTWLLVTVQKENIDSFLQIVIDKKYSLSQRTLLSLSCDLLTLEDINFAMNEVSVSRKDTTLMITIDTFLKMNT